MEYQLIIERIEPRKPEDEGRDRYYDKQPGIYQTSAPTMALSVRISDEQFNAIRKAVLDKF